MNRSVLSLVITLACIVACGGASWPPYEEALIENYNEKQPLVEQLVELHKGTGRSVHYLGHDVYARVDVETESGVTKEVDETEVSRRINSLLREIRATSIHTTRKGILVMLFNGEVAGYSVDAFYAFGTPSVTRRPVVCAEASPRDDAHGWCYVPLQDGWRIEYVW